MLGLNACEGCGGHGPIEVILNGHFNPRVHENVGEYQDLDDRKANLCAYCKAEMEEMSGVDVKKVGP